MNFLYLYVFGIYTVISSTQDTTLDICLVRLLSNRVINVQYPDTVMFDH